MLIGYGNRKKLCYNNYTKNAVEGILQSFSLLKEAIGHLYLDEIIEATEPLFTELVIDKYYQMFGCEPIRENFINRNPIIDSAFNCCFKDNLVLFDLRVVRQVRYKQSYENTNSSINLGTFIVYVQCQIRLDEKLSKFKISAPTLEPKESRIKRGMVACDDNLVPFINNLDQKRVYARMFLDEFCDGYDFSKDHVPVKRIVEEDLGLNIVNEYKLKDGVCGMLCLADDYVETKDKVVYVPAYTILIDREIIKSKSLGAYYYTLMHEIVHYYFHRHFLFLRQIVTGMKPTTNSIIRQSNNMATDSRVERQAESLPAWILLPSFDFSKKYNDLCKVYNVTNGNDKEKRLLLIIEQLAKFYIVSKSTVKYRIGELKLETYGVDLGNDKYKSFFINENETVRMYFESKEIRNKLNNGEIVFIGNRLVKNHSKYVNGRKLTEYGYYHPSECNVKFNRYTFRNYNIDSHFERNFITDAKMTIVNNNNSFSAEEREMYTEIYNVDKLGGHFKGDIGVAIKQIRMIRKVSLEDLEFDTGIPRRKIGEIESGKVEKYDIEELVVIFKALKVDRINTLRNIGKYCDGFEDTMHNALIKGIINKWYDKVSLDEFTTKLNNARVLNEKLRKLNLLGA